MPPAVMELMHVAIVRDGEVIFRRGGRLSRYPDFDLAKRAITELPIALAYQRQKLIPAGPAYLLLMLSRLSVHFWQQERPNEHFEIIIEDYVGDLAHLPLDILDETVRIWRRTGEWFPKISHLLSIAEPLLQKRRDELRKLERVAEALNGSAPYEPPPKTEEEKARVSALVNNTVAGLKAASESPRSKSRGRINLGPPPSDDDAAEYKRLYDNRVEQMTRDGLLTDPDTEIEAELDIDEGDKPD